MIHFLAWYLLVTLLGWLAFPLAWRLFPALADRGFSLARALGLLLWGYLFWMLASLGVIRNDGGGLFLTLLLVAGLSGAALWLAGRRQQAENDGMDAANGPRSIVEWLKSNKRLVITVELLFFLAFALWTFVRASNPSIETTGGEKTMELAFINSILRSPTFPPRDPWLSGYSISYYYFGYVMTAMLAKAAATPGAVAHNLMLALVFALSAVGAYGIVYNLLAAWRSKHPQVTHQPSTGMPLLGPLFLLFVSNFASFLEVIHSRGFFWKFAQGGTATSAFWTWLDIKHLNQPPSLPLHWTPTRFIWWWQTSRVIQDYNLARAWNEIIDEFPAFSYLLGDLHPHVLAMPFGLMLLAAALNLFLGGWKGEMDLRLYRLPVNPGAFLFGALFLGGMAFLNTWDILSGFALLAGAYVLSRALAFGWTWQRVADLFAFGVPIGVLAILFYLPFYIGFSSQAGGILPNLEFPTRGAHLWVVFGPLFLVLFAYLLYLWRGEKLSGKWKAGFSLGIGLAACLWVFSWLLGLLAKLKMPDFVSNYLAAQGFFSAALYFSAATLKRLGSIASLLTLLALLVPSIAFLAKAGGRSREDEQTGPPSFTFHPSSFLLLMILLGALLVLAPEFVFLRDLFGNRTNTIFKFYFQAWQLWSLAAAFGAAVMLRELRGAWKWLYGGGLALVLAAALAFPVFALPNKTNDFQIPAFRQMLDAARAAGIPAPFRAAASVWTLDGAQLFHSRYPDDAAAADWLVSAPIGVVAEAVGGSYTDYARISAYSGQPSVLGWDFHEYQWRGTFEEQRLREADIAILYQTGNWEEALSILQRYQVRYVIVGTLERMKYNLSEPKFQRNLVEVFRSGDVVIYQVP